MDEKVTAALTALKTIAEIVPTMKPHLKVVESALADSARGVPLSALQAMTRHLDALAAAEAGLRGHVQAMEGGVAPPSSKRTRGPNKPKPDSAEGGEPRRGPGRPRIVSDSRGVDPGNPLATPTKAPVASPTRS